MEREWPGDVDLAAAAAELAAELPDELRRLADIAYDYRWSWTCGGREIFESIDPERWQRCGRNPVRLLDETHRRRLASLAHDDAYLARLGALLERIDAASPPAQIGRRSSQDPIAFLCAEFGVHESLPVYSGGLGILAGDYLKEASDRGLAVVGVGLLYRSGYFHQRLDLDGTQHEYWIDTDPERLPAVLVTGADGVPITVTVAVADEDVTVQVWRVAVGRVPLYLLDTDVPVNSTVARWTASRLYEGNRAVRLAQYAVLGVGAVKMLAALGIRPSVVHLNEGHPALAFFELVEEKMRDGASFDEAVRDVRSRIVFTTHTPVPAGNETYQPGEIMSVLGRLAERTGDPQRLLAAGRLNPSDPGESPGMTVLAMRASRSVNAVSRRHGEVARSMWQPVYATPAVDDVPITHVTNGVHIPTWLGEPMRQLFDRHLGEGWAAHADDPATWDAIDDISDADLWQARCDARRQLVAAVDDRATIERLRRGEGVEYAEAVERAFDPEVLTIGFARRLAEYKRLHLVAFDPARAVAILRSPAQFVFAGKAHPQDEGAKRIVERLFALKGSPDVAGRATFLEDYDMALARCLVAGCDVWVNLPRPPLEASGTSGMKVALNGGLHLSVLDGWWSEAYDGSNGWAIDGTSGGDASAQDAAHAAAFYDCLEHDVIPLFHSREGGLPLGWLGMIRRSLRSIAPRFCATRMLADYVERIYERGQPLSPGEPGR